MISRISILAIAFSMLMLLALGCSPTGSTSSVGAVPFATPISDMGPQIENTFDLPPVAFQTLMADFSKEESEPLAGEEKFQACDSNDYKCQVEAFNHNHDSSWDQKISYEIETQKSLLRILPIVEKLKLTVSDKERKEIDKDLLEAKEDLNESIKKLHDAKVAKLTALAQLFKAPYFCSLSKEGLRCPEETSHLKNAENFELFSKSEDSPYPPGRLRSISEAM